MTCNRGAPLVLLLVLLVSATHSQKPEIQHGDDMCIWQGECDPSLQVQDGHYNCFYNGPPTDLFKEKDNHTELYKLIQETCPMYLQPGKGKVCCDKAQMVTLSTQTKLPRQLFARCPACYRNFLDHFCKTTCDPDMSAFMDVQPAFLLNDTGKWYIQQVEIYLSEEYVEELYDSCKDVQYPQASTKVVDIMCGSAVCSAHKWLTYLGTPNLNHFAPFLMNYHFGPKVPEPNMTALSYDFRPCNSSDSDYTCSCSDCPVTCPALPSFAGASFPLMYVTIGIVSGGVFVTLIVFIVTLIVGLVCLGRKKGYRRIGTEREYGRAKYGAVEEENDDSPTSSVGSINADDMPQTKATTTVGDPPSGCCVSLARIGMEWENLIKKVFYHYGKFVAEFWYLVLLFSLLIVIGLGFGLFFFKVTTDPVELWSAPDSRARMEKDYFDEHFEPFYRTEMVIITAPNEKSFNVTPIGVVGGQWTFGPVFNLEVLEEVYRLQDNISKLQVPYMDPNNHSEYNITIHNICLSPLAPENTNCTIFSVLNYFQNNWTMLHHTEDLGLTDYTLQIHSCTRDMTNVGGYFKELKVPCLGAFGGPVDPNVALGGFIKDNATGEFDYDSATALIITMPMHNHINATMNKMAATWEAAFIKFLKSYKGQYINISFSSERSIEDEINRESRTDIATILISYVLMFAYITIFLGHIRSCATIFIDMKLMVGFLGVMMVLVAVVAALGLLSYGGVTATLIIIEVIPFLVLAVGVDNLFILVHSYERQCRLFSKNLHEIPVKELIGRALGDVAPSLILTSFSETAAFLLGGISSMPAVRTFSFYAGTAVFFNFLLQISAFVAIMSLDARRQLANRYDILACIKKKGTFDPKVGWDILRLIMKYLAKVLLFPVVRPFVLLFFGLTATASLAMVFRIDIGLDQNLALPKDSFLINYFNDLQQYLHTGPPVYFVIKDGFQYTNTTQQNLICSGKGCSSASLGTQIQLYSRESNVTYIAEPAMLWLDTYFEWLSPSGDCCGYYNDSSSLEECYAPGNTTGNRTCMKCLQHDRPNATEFMTFLEWFLNDNPGTNCAAGGHAAFDTAVIRNHKTRNITTSYAMSYHTICKTSADYINSLRIARELSDNLTHTLGVTVYPYSVFYVYYEQYLTTVHDMCLNIGLSLGAVFVVSFFLLGFNLWAALIVLFTVSLIILHMLGFMALLGINANAVSLVNLVMAVGISVEFCSHTIRWFTYCPEPTRYDRALSALSNMGASVFSGITLTKFIGVFILAFAKSQLFQVYYFRMYMCMLLWGALIGLVFLPVLLSYVGPPHYPISLPSPFKDPLGLPTSHPPTTSNNSNGSAKGKKQKKKEEQNGHIPANGTSSQHTQYPSLPDTGSYTVGDLQAQEQGYPKSSRPKDGGYLPYEDNDVPTERSNLITH